MQREEIISGGVWRQHFSHTETDRQRERGTDRESVRNRLRKRIRSKIICNGGQHPFVNGDDIKELYEKRPESWMRPTNQI